MLCTECLYRENEMVKIRPSTVKCCRVFIETASKSNAACITPIINIYMEFFCHLYPIPIHLDTGGRECLCECVCRPSLAGPNGKFKPSTTSQKKFKIQNQFTSTFPPHYSETIFSFDFAFWLVSNSSRLVYLQTMNFIWVH